MNLAGIRRVLEEVGFGGADALHQLAHDLTPLVLGALDIPDGVPTPVVQPDLLVGDAGAVQGGGVRGR